VPLRDTAPRSSATWFPFSVTSPPPATSSPTSARTLEGNRKLPQQNSFRTWALTDEYKPDEQTLLILRVDKGQSWKEIAHVLAASEDASPDVGVLRKRHARLKKRRVRMTEKVGLFDLRTH
jgi:DNA-directed RNA polymerase specialized sigma24 family protein